MKPTAVTAAFATAAPPAQSGKGYNLEEIEQKLAKGAGISGVHKADLPTPSLLLDLDSLEFNINRAADHAKKYGIDLRPHAKTHKTPEIAKLQIAAGAVGVSCATIREAEVLTDAGVGGLLITSELVGPNKIARLLRLARRAPDVMAVVDNPIHAEQLSEAATAANVKLNILIDIDPTGRRSGIAPGPAAVELGKKVDSLPGLELWGVHGYSGASSHVVGFEARKEHSTQYMTPVIDSFQQMAKAGAPARIMSGGSTGTYNIDCHLDGMNELQMGSYIVMDVDYRRIGGASGEVYTDFKPALTVLATVVNKNYDDIATVDSGIKSFATDRTCGPEPLLDGVTYSINGDEHGRLHLENAKVAVNFGDKVELIVPHCDPNVNLYERIYVCRGDNVVEVWKVGARGNI
ncbi:MAG: DSD1 family PLP-dependent enzyme [Acidobacteria bacterium]|nr:DSD1 family PLP-dependent enzyme [Acidobacteriota bacterium]